MLLPLLIMKRLSTILLLLIAYAVAAKADLHFPDFRFTHFTTENGLPSNRIRDIVQDNEGFMWFATEAGLVRYDGTTTKVFTPYADNAYSCEVYIMSICKNGNKLLVGTDQNLYSYCPRKERMEPLHLKYDSQTKERLSGAIHDICVDATGTIWVSAEDKGIFRIAQDGTVKGVFKFPELQNFIGMLYVDSNDVVWGVSSMGNGGVLRFDSNSGSFINFPITIGGHPSHIKALAMVADEYGYYYLGTWENGIVRFNGRTGEGNFLSTTDSPQTLHIHSIAMYNPTTLLVGSDSGLTLVDTNTGESKLFTDDELNANSLSDRFVYPVTIDSDGGLWVGTFYRGVNYQSPDSKRFHRWRHSRFANSVCGNVVSRLCEDKFGNIWIGTADGGLCRYNPQTSVFTKYPLEGCRGNDNINALCIDNNSLWVGTYAKGVGKLDISTGKWSRIPVDGNENVSCYAICKDSKDNVWIGATEHFALYDGDKNCFVNIKDLNAWICDIDEDKEGNLWISTQGSGLYKHNPSSGKWTNFKADNSPGSLPHNHINSVKVDNSGSVYVSTTFGVYLYDPATSKFSKIDLDIPGMIANAMEKSGDDFWISTESGLINLKPDGKVRVYHTADGLSDNQFIQGASLQASDGMIYYGTVNGFCSVDPLMARNSTTAPKLKFTGLDIINTPVEVGDPHLPVALNSLDQLLLTHADHAFSIYFSALSFSNQNSVSYQYKLDGFDKTWIDAGKENRATYSNIPPGTYTLRVKGSNADGVWNDEGISLKIVVKPAWYATAIMKTIYILIGLAVLLLGVRYIVWRMERNHMIELDRITASKEKEMYRSKLSFFTIVAHEIRTPVSLIIGPLEKVTESTDKFSPSLKEDLNVINRNAHRLLSLINQLLDFRKVEDNAIPIWFRHTRITPLVESVAERFRPSVEHKGGTLTVDCPDPDLTADVDVEALTKLVSNFLNNARKFTKDKIHVECRPLPDGKRFLISVSDNGIGISKENRDKVFKPFFQVLDNINESKGGTGLGLAIVKNVADSHGGSVELDSSPGKGAKFTVILPIKQENVIPEEAGNPVEEESSVIEAATTAVTEAKPVLLVVEDNEEMLNFIAANFKADYDVVTATNGKEALTKMKHKAVSLIISDWMMPVMDGVEFLKAVRDNENYSHIPFVMLTAKTDNTSKIETMRSGADAYVEKPFSIGFLKARIENLLEMREMLRRKYSASPLEPIETLAPTPLDNELLKRLQTIIEENIANPELNVDFLVEKMGIGRSSLYSKIKTLADISPNELIQLTRLKKGAELLKSGNYRVNEVSFMVGFSSTSYFSRCFHKQFGIKPNEFLSTP